MKILLDECVTKKLKQHLDGFEVRTVVEMGWSGFRNGTLLRAAVEAQFDVLLSIDRNMAFQQNMANYDIAVVVFDTQRSKVQVLVKFLPEFTAKIGEYSRGQISLLEANYIESDLEH
jgi:hypothetical protein